MLGRNVSVDFEQGKIKRIIACGSSGHTWTVKLRKKNKFKFMFVLDIIISENYKSIEKKTF